MLNKLILGIADFQDKHPLAMLSLALVLTVFLGYHAVNIQTDATFDTMYREDSQFRTLKDFVSNEFGSTDTLFILMRVDESIDDSTKVEDIREPIIYETIEILTASLEEETTVASIFSVNDLMYQQYGRLPETLEESKEMLANLQQDSGFLMSNSYRAANLIVSVDIANKPGSLERIEQVMRKKIADAQIPVGVEVILTGQPTMLNRIMNLLIRDNVVTIGIALFFVLIVLYIFFRSLPLAIITLVPVILTLLWLAGTMRLLDIRITMMVAAIGAMMVGLGVDYGIHMSHAYHHNLLTGKKNVTRKTVLSVGSALFASALTTLGGFGAMLTATGPSPVIQGTVLSMGIIYAFISTLIVLPCLLVLMRKLNFNPLHYAVFKLRSHKKHAKVTWMKKMLGALAHFQTAVPKTILAIFVVITFFIAPGAANVRFDTDNENWIPDNDPVINAFEEVNYEFGGTDQMNLIVMLDRETTNEREVQDLRDPEVLRAVEAMESSLESLDYVGSITSPTDTIKALNNGKIPQDIEIIKNIIESAPSLRNAFNVDYSAVRLNVVSDAFGDPAKQEPEKNYLEMMREVESIQFPQGVVVKAQGGPAQFVELQATLQSDTAKTTLIGFFLVIVIASLLYKSVTVGMLAFFPIIFSMIWTVGIMGYVDLPFTVLTSGLLAIVMGIGVDFSIHLIHKAKEHLAEGFNIVDSIEYSLTSTGEAIMMSTITTIIGFASLLLASLLVTQRLGMTLAIAIGASFFCCILLVPAVLTIEHQLKRGSEE